MQSQRTRLRPAARIGIVASSLAAAAILLLPNVAFAVDTPFGSATGAVTCEAGFDIIQTASTGSIYTVPPGGGVITSWSTLAGNVNFPGPLQLEVWRLTTPGTYTLAAISAPETPTTPSVVNHFTANIAVLGGELLGLHSVGPIMCLDNTLAATDVVAYFPDLTPGTPPDQTPTTFIPGMRLDLAAVLSTSPPPPPPPPSDGCDQTGDSAANAQCKDDHKSKEGDKKPSKPDAQP